MTANASLSIPNALKHERPDDYYKNAATIEWPLGAARRAAFRSWALSSPPWSSRPAATSPLAKEFVRFLVAEGWLAHYLDFAGERLLPAMPKLLEQPFWLDPSDPHRMGAAMQIADPAHALRIRRGLGQLASRPVWQEHVWGKAVHRVVADGISPEQAVDEAIARIKQILAE